MRNVRIAYTRPDGRLCIVVPAPNFVAQFDREEQALAVILKNSVPTYAQEVRVVNAANFPADRIFRNAWQLVLDGVQVNMEQARLIHMNRIRAARDAVLSSLDVKCQRAEEERDEQKKVEILAKKQTLRDLPETFDLTRYKTSDELMLAWPDELNAKVV